MSTPDYPTDPISYACWSGGMSWPEAIRHVFGDRICNDGHRIKQIGETIIALSNASIERAGEPGERTIEHQRLALLVDMISVERLRCEMALVDLEANIFWLVERNQEALAAPPVESPPDPREHEVVEEQP